MRRDKKFVFSLRQDGKSYREIQKETGVSRATLTTWFRGIPWSNHISEEHRKKNLGASKERIGRMNIVRKLKLQYQYALVESAAEKQYQAFRKEPLFWAGLMGYAGAGDKRSKNLVRISSADFYLHRIFISFCKEYLDSKEEDFRFALLLYPDHIESVCKEVWTGEFAVQTPIFHKTQVIKGKGTITRLQYGIGMSIISSTSLKKKMLKWLSLAESENFK